jgi:hypothetical protein
MPTNIKYLDEYEDKHNYRNIQVPDTASLEFEPLKPSPSKDAYCKVHLIKNSDLTMGLSVFVRTSDTDAQITLPVYTFMLEVSVEDCSRTCLIMGAGSVWKSVTERAAGHSLGAVLTPSTSLTDARSLSISA